MKKIYISLAVMLIASLGFAQIVNPKMTHRKANLTKPKCNKEKGVLPLFTSYFWSESDMYGGFFTDGGNYYYTGSEVNVNYTKDNIGGYRSIAVAFNKFINSTETENPTEILKSNINSMKLDSVMISLWHTNTSGTENQLIVTILKTDNVGNPINQVLWKDSISSSTSLSKDGMNTVLVYRPELNIADKKFAVMFQFKGDITKDTCAIMVGFGSTETCSETEAPIAVESMYYPNTFGMYAWLNNGELANMFIPQIDPETGEVNGVVSSCGQTETPAWLQNANISAFLTLDTTDNTGIKDMATNIANLSQNQPNPANGITNISFELVKNSNVLFNVVDLTGRLVYSETVANAKAGANVIEFNATDLQKGVYFYSIEANGAKLTKKMIVE